MKKYIVSALVVGGLGSLIHNSGEEVTDANFPPGHAEELVKQGFLREASDEELKAIAKAEKEAKEEAVKIAEANAKAEAAAKAEADKLAEEEAKKKKIADAQAKKLAEEEAKKKK